MLLAWFCLVMGFAAMSLGMVAVADEHGNRLIAGVLEMVAAIGSVTGGLVGGALPGRHNSYAWRRMLALTVLIMGCVFVTSSVVGLAVMMFAAGCLIAPTIAAVYERVGVLTPTAAHTEIFGWMQSGGMVGSAVGAAVAGAAVEAFGVRYAWVLAAGLGVLATAVPAARAAPPAGRVHRLRSRGRRIVHAVAGLQYAAVPRAHGDQPQRTAIQQRPASRGAPGG